MADPQRPNTAPLVPGLASLCRDAQALAANYPAPQAEKPGTWHPAPWSIPTSARRLCDGAPPYIN